MPAARGRAGNRGDRTTKQGVFVRFAPGSSPGRNRPGGRLEPGKSELHRDPSGLPLALHQGPHAPATLYQLRDARRAEPRELHAALLAATRSVAREHWHCERCATLTDALASHPVREHAPHDLALLKTSAAARTGTSLHERQYSTNALPKTARPRERTTRRVRFGTERNACSCSCSGVLRAPVVRQLEPASRLAQERFAARARFDFVVHCFAFRFFGASCMRASGGVSRRQSLPM